MGALGLPEALSGVTSADLPEQSSTRKRYRPPASPHWSKAFVRASRRSSTGALLARRRGRRLVSDRPAKHRRDHERRRDLQRIDV